VIRTWHIEALVMLTVLASVAYVTGNAPTEWIGTAAVFVTFLHAQIADRMQERQAASASPDVPCHWKASYYFIGKELLWVAYFVAHRSYAALVGCGLFLAYPLWRRSWRRGHPMGVSR
jgi:hypothetical protein